MPRSVNFWDSLTFEDIARGRSVNMFGPLVRQDRLPDRRADVVDRRLHQVVASYETTVTQTSNPPTTQMT